MQSCIIKQYSGSQCCHGRVYYLDTRHCIKFLKIPASTCLSVFSTGVTLQLILCPLLQRSSTTTSDSARLKHFLLIRIVAVLLPVRVDTCICNCICRRCHVATYALDFATLHANTLQLYTFCFAILHFAILHLGTLQLNTLQVYNYHFATFALCDFSLCDLTL